MSTVEHFPEYTTEDPTVLNASNIIRHKGIQHATSLASRVIHPNGEPGDWFICPMLFYGTVLHDVFFSDEGRMALSDFFPGVELLYGFFSSSLYPFSVMDTLESDKIDYTKGLGCCPLKDFDWRIREVPLPAPPIQHITDLLKTQTELVQYGNKEHLVLSLSDLLLYLDLYIATGSGGRVASKVNSRLGTLIERSTYNLVVSASNKIPVPTAMGFCLTYSEIPIGSVGMPYKQAYKYVRYLIDYEDPDYLENLAISAGLENVYREYQQQETLHKSYWNAHMPTLIRALHGKSCFRIRYPIGNPKSFSCTDDKGEIARLHIMSGKYTPDALFLNPFDLMHYLLGDCDGDTIAVIMLKSQLAQHSPNLPPVRLNIHPRRFYTHVQDSPVGYLKPLPKLDEYGVLESFFVRGDYIGLLTYLVWCLIYVASFEYEAMQLSSRSEVIPIVWGYFTPLIEGVMNARKGENSTQMAMFVTECLMGKRCIRELSQILPIKEPHEIDEERFTKQQVGELMYILSLFAKQDENGELRVNLPTVCKQSVAPAIMSSRFNPVAIRNLWKIESNNGLTAREFLTKLQKGFSMETPYDFEGFEWKDLLPQQQDTQDFPDGIADYEIY